MRKIILNLAVSLDGYIEGPNGEYDWCFNDQDYGLTDFFNNCDAMFIGRKSYETVVAIDPAMFAALKMYVFSGTLTSLEGNTEIITRENFQDKINEIRNQPGGNIWLFGGANLVTDFVEHNLITEFLLSVHPVILGSGKPLFSNIKERKNLMLLGSEQFSSGLMQLRYALKPEFDMSMFDKMQI